MDAVCLELDLGKPRQRIYRNMYECRKYGWWPSKYEVQSRLFEPNQSLVVDYALFLPGSETRSVPISDQYLQTSQLMALVMQDSPETRHLEHKDSLWLYHDNLPVSH